MNIKKTKRNKIVFIITGLIVVAAAGILLWQNNTRKATNPTESTNQNQQQSQPTNEQSQTPTTDTSSQPSQETPVKNYETITENEQYQIRREPNTNNYVITLYAIINRPDQYDQYQDQLREFKHNALQYLQNTGVDTNTINITYEPEEAKDL